MEVDSSPCLDEVAGGMESGGWRPSHVEAHQGSLDRPYGHQTRFNQLSVENA